MTVSELQERLSAANSGAAEVIIKNTDERYDDKYVIKGVYQELPAGDIVLIAEAVIKA